MTTAQTILEKETIQILLDLLNPLHGSLDRQVGDQLTDEREIEPPRDREYNVDITAQQERDLTQAVCILENRLRQAAAPQGREALEAEAQAKAQDIYICATEENRALKERIAMLIEKSTDEDYLQEVADGAWGDDPRVRGLARDRLAALTPAAAPDAGTLRDALTEYARDLRRNSSGGDDYPWEIMGGVADYLDALLQRHPTSALAQAQEPGEDKR